MAQLRYVAGTMYKLQLQPSVRRPIADNDQVPVTFHDRDIEHESQCHTDRNHAVEEK